MNIALLPALPHLVRHRATKILAPVQRHAFLVFGRPCLVYTIPQSPDSRCGGVGSAATLWCCCLLPTGLRSLACSTEHLPTWATVAGSTISIHQLDGLIVPPLAGCTQHTEIEGLEPLQSRCLAG